MDQVQSFSSLIVANPLFAGLLALVIVMVGSAYLRHRRDSAFWASVALLKEEQYRDAREREIERLVAFGRRRGQEQLVLQALADIRRLHAGGVKHGHLWFIVWRMLGVVPGDVPPPACTRAGGGLEAFKHVPVDVMRRKW